MQLTCPRCRRVLEFSGERPCFCAWCGSALAETRAFPPTSGDPEAPTLAPGPAAPDEEAVPEVLGGYRLLRRLGGGAMGTVYEAEDTASGRRVALKLICADYAGSADAVQRFRQEGRLASAIAHPRCVFVLAADEEAGRPYIVMELMPGPTLQELVEKRGPLPPEEAVAKALDIIEGLQEAHRLGVVHRDVKPSNCFLGADGRVKVGDFGLSKSLAGGAHLTRTGAFIGTPLFASPEQVRGEPFDEQSDLYAVAATLYALLTGQAPFQGGDPTATLARIVSDDPPPMRRLRADLPAALDRVVLRGLERDRARRWRDLEALRRALLPFVPGRLSFAGLGSRFGAYLIDVVASYLAVGILMVPFVLLLPEKAGAELAQAQPLHGFLVVLYYGIPEGLWGWSPGKRLLGLRVRTARGFEAPGVPRALLRALVFYLTLNVGSLVTFFVVYPYHPTQGWDYARLYQEHFLIWLAATALPTGWYLLGAAVLASTMRARNGYRGLHELLSDTRVIALPASPPVRAVMPHGLDADAVHDRALPERLGSFTVRGALRRDETSAVLLGESLSLGRQVLLWLRPAADAPLSEARRDLARAARLRWLAAGHHEEWQWDAFLTPAGCPLADWVAADGRLSWADVRPVLDDLTAELIAADEDGTLPPTLALGQVWVAAGGRVLLLDVPPAGDDAAEADSPFDLLACVARFGLEGRRRAGAGREPVRAPVPGYARALLDRLVGAGRPWKTLREWQRGLAAVAGRPPEVTRGRRAGHVALLALFLTPGLLLMLVPALLTVVQAISYSAVLTLEGQDLQAFDAGATREFVASCVGPAPGSRLAALVQLDRDWATRARLEERLRHHREAHQAVWDGLSPVGRWYAGYNEQYLSSGLSGEAVIAGGAGFRQRAEFRLRAPDLGDPWDTGAAVGGTLFVLFPAAFWVLWAFAWRGGLSDRILGLAVVQSDGRPAARWRCALRALLVWTPVAALLIAALWLEFGYWLTRGEVRPALWLLSLSWAASWSAWALLAVFAVLAIRSPARGLHDRLAGTRVVPR